MNKTKFETPEIDNINLDGLDIIETSTDNTEVLNPTNSDFIPIDDFTS